MYISDADIYEKKQVKEKGTSAFSSCPMITSVRVSSAQSIKISSPL